jgi:uncharacterized protein YcbK (DUF882 family)
MQTKATYNPYTFQIAALSIAMAAGGSITSTFRTSKHNTAVGGVPNSFHLKGMAADLVLDDPKTENIVTAMAAYLNIQVVKETDHIHLEVF